MTAMTRLHIASHGKGYVLWCPVSTVALHHATTTCNCISMHWRLSPLWYRNTHMAFVVPCTHLWFTDGSFAVSRPEVWNALPSGIHSIACKDTFTYHLKTFFYSVLLIKLASHNQFLGIDFMLLCFGCLCIFIVHYCTVPLSLVQWRLAW